LDRDVEECGTNEEWTGMAFKRYDSVLAIETGNAEPLTSYKDMTSHVEIMKCTILNREVYDLLLHKIVKLFLII